MSILFRILAANIAALALTVGLAMAATQAHADGVQAKSSAATPDRRIRDNGRPIPYCNPMNPRSC